jgi:hypothetical protein
MADRPGEVHQTSTASGSRLGSLGPATPGPRQGRPPSGRSQRARRHRSCLRRLDWRLHVPTSRDETHPETAAEQATVTAAAAVWIKAKLPEMLPGVVRRHGPTSSLSPVPSRGRPRTRRRDRPASRSPRRWSPPDTFASRATCSRLGCSVGASRRRRPTASRVRLWASRGSGSSRPIGHCWPRFSISSHDRPCAGCRYRCTRTRSCAGSATSYGRRHSQITPMPGAAGHAQCARFGVLVLAGGRENPDWGYRRIHELPILGVKVARGTVWEIIRAAGSTQQRRRREPTWAAYGIRSGTVRRAR